MCEDSVVDFEAYFHEASSQASRIGLVISSTPHASPHLRPQSSPTYQRLLSNRHPVVHQACGLDQPDIAVTKGARKPTRADHRAPGIRHTVHSGSAPGVKGVTESEVKVRRQPTHSRGYGSQVDHKAQRTGPKNLDICESEVEMRADVGRKDPRHNETGGDVLHTTGITGHIKAVNPNRVAESAVKVERLPEQTYGEDRRKVPDQRTGIRSLASKQCQFSRPRTHGRVADECVGTNPNHRRHMPRQVEASHRMAANTHGRMNSDYEQTPKETIDAHRYGKHRDNAHRTQQMVLQHALEDSHGKQALSAKGCTKNCLRPSEVKSSANANLNSGVVYGRERKGNAELCDVSHKADGPEPQPCTTHGNRPYHSKQLTRADEHYRDSNKALTHVVRADIREYDIRYERACDHGHQPTQAAATDACPPRIKPRAETLTNSAAVVSVNVPPPPPPPPPASSLTTHSNPTVDPDGKPVQHTGAELNEWLVRVKEWQNGVLTRLLAGERVPSASVRGTHRIPPKT
ncbi:hypothetical protein SARC_09884 [Sphaeroforma arctica JP610]|uniref:Uncharacterized protein n=1 Tax=Sphaeroforma arctica JP610 TaxID=667725 RepID=A0A0L0FLK9_9EUKA|nr:hypothetical protein SARC_09884 [Sphaeroforma arctica JP610]KNC77662.1 hypothetical protein SARC_09884 [Sphaeroforma arctica JP610]|eukprot:XP_014151564.1 hypothetical protein SARC_09884 [Sphaeroforma arctica JP610]